MRVVAATQVTDSPEFRRWFGASKVVDSNGQPLVVYHGTGKKFDRFDDNQDGAYYFSPSKRFAEWFADNSDRGWWRSYTPQVLDCYLSIQNPKVMTYAQLREEIGDDADDTGLDWTSIGGVIEDAKSSGHDGMHLIGLPEYDGSRDDQWLAFEPEQIKSASRNNGKFSPKTANIYK